MDEWSPRHSSPSESPVSPERGFRLRARSRRSIPVSRRSPIMLSAVMPPTPARTNRAANQTHLPAFLVGHQFPISGRQASHAFRARENGARAPRSRDRIFHRAVGANAPTGHRKEQEPVIAIQHPAPPTILLLLNAPNQNPASQGSLETCVISTPCCASAISIPR
jgi:hypothetical protein